MQKAQVSRVIKLLSRLDGRDAKRNRVELLEKINGVRQMLWHNESCRYGAFKEEGCAVVQCFREPCRNCSCTPVYYNGISLPPLVCNITEIYKDGCHFEIGARRVSPAGCGTSCGGCYLAEQLEPRLLECDIPCKSNGRVVFQSTVGEDDGLTVGVRYIDPEGREHREDMELAQGGVVTEVSVFQFLEITFPERCGHINVHTEDGYFLGKYHPSITSPEHLHYRLNGASEGDRLSWRGMQEPYDLRFDTDPVEFSDEPKWAVCLKVFGLMANVELTNAQRIGEVSLTEKLAAFFAADLTARNENFVGRIMPATRKAMFSTAALMSGQRRFLR